MKLPPDLENALEGIIRQIEDAPVLIAAPPDVPVEGLCGAARTTRFTLTREAVAPARLATMAHHRLAVVIDAPLAIGTVETYRFLAWLRNVGAYSVIAAFDRSRATADPVMPWTQSRFLGLGFRRAAMARELDVDYWLYRYNIHDYKITPDWLNARHWANPGRWDEERW